MQKWIDLMEKVGGVTLVEGEFNFVLNRDLDTTALNTSRDKPN